MRETGRDRGFCMVGYNFRAVGLASLCQDLNGTREWAVWKVGRASRLRERPRGEGVQVLGSTARGSGWLEWSQQEPVPRRKHQIQG